MMRKRLILILSFIAFSVGCATSNTADEEKSTLATEAKVSTDRETDLVLNERLKKNNVTSIDNLSEADKLSVAIKQSNDVMISEAASQVLTKNPKDIRALNALAMSYYKRSRHEAAEYLLTKAIAVDEKSAELYSNLGLVKLAQGEKREAIKAFRKGLQLKPQDAVIGSNLGAIYVAEKDYTKAELALEIPYKKGTKDIKVLNNYAVALTGVGKANQAQEIYESLLKENSGQRDIMLNYSILLIEHKQKYREGLDILNRLKFVGVPLESRNLIKDLESKAKAGLK